MEFSGVTAPKSALRMSALAATFKVPGSAAEPYFTDEDSVAVKTEENA